MRKIKNGSDRSLRTTLRRREQSCWFPIQFLTLILTQIGGWTGDKLKTQDSSSVASVASSGKKNVGYRRFSHVSENIVV